MIIYNLVVSFYGLLIRTAALKKEKAKLWVEGRREWKLDLSGKLKDFDNRPRIWVHCASYGEFEQGRPLIEQVRKQYPRYQIVLSFFSPSGYEAFKNYTGVDLICYLPLDSKQNAKDFIDLVRPDYAVFVKYEFWLHYLFELKARKIPTYLVSATFKPHHPFFKPYGKIFRRSLETFNKIFLQDQNSVKLLEKIGITNVIVAGDTRFDRVIDVKNNFKGFDELAAFKADHFLLIAGSTWPKDEDLILTALEKLDGRKIKLIIAPHELDAANINSVVEKLKKTQLSFCLYSRGIDTDKQVLILDKMGLLSRIYYYGDCAYVGGGFNGGIHNTLEPAVYGQPVFFYGNDFQKFNEAVTMVSLGAAKDVTGAEELSVEISDLLKNPKRKGEVRKILEHYFEKNTNVSGRILKEISLK